MKKALQSLGWKGELSHLLTDLAPQYANPTYSGAK